MDRHTREQRVRNMRAIRSSGTRIEVLLGRAMWKVGLRYRKQAKGLPGKPDFSFKRLKVAVFVDGEFWHGKEWEIRKHWIKSNRDFWYAKIERNMARDAETTSTLEGLGWRVIRFWGDEVQQDAHLCALKVSEAVEECRENLNKSDSIT